MPQAAEMSTEDNRRFWSFKGSLSVSEVSGPFPKAPLPFRTISCVKNQLFSAYFESCAGRRFVIDETLTVQDLREFDGKIRCRVQLPNNY
jgi:hypothetical protein